MGVLYLGGNFKNIIMRNKWKEICYLINIKRELSEELFQPEIINILEKLGWSRYLGEIVEKKAIPTGAANYMIPDIVVKDKDVDNLFVIELKKPAEKHKERNNEQIYSYMRQLKLNVGLLINDRIHVFYDSENSKIPTEVMNIEFIENSEEGIKFLELFDKSKFNRETLTKFCIDKLKCIDLIDSITSEDYKGKVMQLIKEDVQKQGVEENIISEALENIELTFTNTLDLKESYGEKFKNTEKENIIINEEIDDNEAEIEKVKRKIPRWMNKPDQINSKILLKAMSLLAQKKSISFDVFKRECEDIKSFLSNFNQMANFGKNNHGKVFDKDGDILKLWEPIEGFVRGIYEEMSIRGQIHK